jgi:succinate dehydrogenase / fumarate reductase cytochrome b subunit
VLAIYEENREGVSGWFRLRRYSVERALYLVQRLSGIGIVIFAFVHLLYTSWHPGGWGDVILGIFVVYHTLNGLRLVLTEHGFLIGRPIRAVYPYRKGTLYGSQRYLVMVILALFVIFILIWSYVALVIQAG